MERLLKALHVLHIHVFLAPLSFCDMVQVAQVYANKYQGGIAVGEGTHNPGTTVNLAIKVLNDVVCTEGQS